MINTFSDRNNVALSATPSLLLKSRKTFKDEKNLPIMEPQETKFFPFQAGSFLCWHLSLNPRDSTRLPLKNSFRSPIFRLRQATLYLHSCLCCLK